MTRTLQLAALFLALTTTARAVELKITAAALERTLHKQLFNTPDGRYYIRGKAGSACYVYAQDPKVSFKDDRVVVHVTTHAKLGTSLKGLCLGLGLTEEADVSIVPDAQGESIGFRDPRIDHLSTSRELNFFLTPFLSGKLPQKLTVNAADLLKDLLKQSTATTGYDITLDNLKIHSMQVDHDKLIVDFDGDLSVK